MERCYFQPLMRSMVEDEQALFLVGARQVGKTTLARQLMAGFSEQRYLNWDNLDHRVQLLKGPSAILEGLPLDVLGAQKPVLCLDEIHKFKDWKTLTKGLMDTYRDKLHLIVTGSAKLDVFHRGGDSLMGRYFLHRIHPFSVAELCGNACEETLTAPPRSLSDDVWQALLTFGGFPDPFLKAEVRYAARWQRLRHQQLFQEDLRDLASIQDLQLLEVLATLLTDRVGDLIAYTNLAKHVRVSDQTIRRWLSVLEAVYFCFKVSPYATNLSRSLRKEPKVYLWDWSQVKDPGKRAENLVASHMLKAVHFWNDQGFGEFELTFLRTKDQKEVDFLVVKDQQPWLMVEVKQSGKTPLSPHLFYFQERLKAKHVLQVAMDLPFVEQDCFDLIQPTIVPARTLLSQLV